MRNRPGILVFRDHRPTIKSILEHTEEELGIRLGAVDPHAGEESIEVVVHSLTVFRCNDRELTASNAWFFLYFNGLVVIGNPAFRTDTAPVA